MKTTYLILLLIISSMVFAGTDFYNKEYLTMSSDVTGTLNIEKKPNYQIDYIKTDLSYFPKETEHQNIISSNVYPDAKKNDDSIMFTWNDVKEIETFSINSTIKVKNEYTKIKKQLPFPINKIDNEFNKYLSPTENIDSNNTEIINIAAEIVKGETDLYVASFKLATWIRDNIKYSLDSLTADSVQKPSWVIQNRYGVCDEITALYIAMARSVNIPARYISGLAWTNYGNINDWAPHAWAELYFPHYGWVPFDITYNELGHIDPTHIVLHISNDSDTTSTTYEWKSKNVKIKSSPLEFKTSIINSGSKLKNNLDITLKPNKEKIAIGSYNQINLNIVNNNDYYVTEYLSIVAPEELEIENKKIDVLLKPLETKKINFIIKVNPNLSKDYIYEFPILAITNDNTSYGTKFKASKEYNFYDNEYFKIPIETEKNIQPKNIELNCTNNKNSYYNYENITLNCNIKNLGNELLNNIEVSIEDAKEIMNVSIGKNHNFNLSCSITNANKKDYQVKVKHDKFELTKNIKINTLDTPNLTISNITAPSKVQYNNIFDLSVMIKKSSLSTAKNVILTIQGKKITLDDLEKDHNFILKMKGSNLIEGTNKIKVSLKYQDNNEKIYTSNKQIEIELENLTFLQKIITTIKNFFKLQKKGPDFSGL